MSRRTSKQRRAAKVRAWIRRHLFVDQAGVFLLPALVFFARRSPVPFGPSRLVGLGWRKSMNHDGFILPRRA